MNINSKFFRGYVSKMWHSKYVQMWVPSKIYIKIQYRNYTGKRLDLRNPQTFNEKLQWLKLYDRNPLYTNLVDKYKVREFISQTIGEEYLIPLLGVWDKFDEIDFGELPNKFVLKPNHTSGDVFICKDKTKVNFDELRTKVNAWLEREYYWEHREWPYKNIKPRIICEKYMVDESGIELKDYKFLCFNGEPKIIQVMSGRKNGNYYINHYDINWDRVEIHRKRCAENPKGIDKPAGLQTMIDISRRLSRDIPFVRVDLYSTARQILFGEMTFYPVSGYMDFQDERWDYKLGSWIELPYEQ